MTIRTRLCDELGIDVPIFNVGFGGGATASLAAAVSNAGGCGVIGSAGLPAAAVRPEIVRARELTARPFGVNVIIAGMSDPTWSRAIERQVAVCVDERVPLLVLFWGDPAPFVEHAHAVGTKVFVQIGSVAEAVSAAEAGVDAVIAQGVEAGGHVKGRTPIWELLPACIDAIAPTPVLASGGIGDGASLARALAAGAQGVSLGTVFLGAEEADIHSEYRQRIVDAGAGDTVYTENLFDIGWPDAPHRALRAKTYDEWEAAGRPVSGQRPGEGTTIGAFAAPVSADVPRYGAMMATSGFEGDIGYASLWAGETVGMVRRVEPAAAIVQRLVHDAGLAADQAR